MPTPPPASDSQDATLVFTPTGQPQGFATLATTQWDGNPEPVIREILQNSLDACVKVERACEVSFTIGEVACHEIPGMEDYERHFRDAERERSGHAQGPAEKKIIKAIEKVLGRDRVGILFCRDNGIGLNADSMGRLLTEGNTDKTDAGAGAFGVGHLTAFAASDTRYVLYAGRSRDGGGISGAGSGGNGAHGSLRDVASAHAILASRIERNADGSVREGLGAHGFLLQRGTGGTTGEQLGLFDPKFPGLAPGLLRSQLQELPDTGTVLCITGFNRFRNDDEDPVDAIARVSAKNFLVAIQCGAMVVRVRDETARPPRTDVVDGAGLRVLLRKFNSQKRTRSGWLPGEQAYRCLRTLEEGEPLTLGCGAEARVRRLPPSEGTTSHVQLFRNGMWITNRADKLTPPNFGSCNPFDAAIMIEDGEIADLVRGAEGPEHRGLDRRRLGARRSRQRLLNLLREIRSELRRHAGEVEQTTLYTPEDFAVFGKRGGQVAETVARYQPRRVPEDDADTSEITTPLPSGDGDAKAIDPPGGGTGKASRGAKPLPGRGVRGRSSILAVRNGDGEIDTLRVYWQPERSDPRTAGALGVRARIPSGSDETCELPLGPTWLRLKELRLDGRNPVPPNPDGYEALLPDGEFEFELKLAAPVPDANVLEVDFVRRATPAPDSDADAADPRGRADGTGTPG